ncbi:protein disulfide-isomerase domain protein [Necator americanus]|uniref:DnaJ homolog subfamily C member 10 n=1 Tax=Necator americanus TaxID=51031 RepID=W2T4Q8_NECAM|nr:protein disulfide-isomerase domain protein [Necator americanus]ETN75942.1 protein disulfide-isomerase domain protein [Necator americanus]
MRISLLFLVLTVLVVADEDYYKLLGIERDADDRTIRKAFKKLAIQKHPDKNKDNPNAHAEFVKINKAYEVLKDEETRKKYDQFGEKGLENGFNGGNNYQSWQFYNENFGIYDDDPEIVTLNRADFQRQVSDTNEMWFINFYSTYCSHCHQLAPTWRKFARAMEGAVRIGAVNCAEDPALCQSQRVHAYPSLVVYPTGEFYNGVRDVELLQDFILQRMTSEVLHLKSENIEALTMEWQPYDSRPWIIDFCDESDACLSSVNRRKLAAMLEGLVNVGTVDCTARGEHELCELLDASTGVSFYPARKVQKGYEQQMSSLDPRELSEEVLNYLEDLEEVKGEELEQLFGENGADWPTVVLFVPNKNVLNERKEYKKLPAVMPDVRILFADCSKSMDRCRQTLDIQKLPQFVTFKTTGGYEIDYVNKKSYHDVRAFIKESIASPLHVLNEETYNAAINSKELWIIDYFAPWCPPCLRLIGEYRRLHSMINRADEVLSKIKIGLIDCQKYNQICRNDGVQSYPTSALYTLDDRIHKFVGYHAAATMLELIDNALNPAVDELTPEQFTELVDGRKEDETWLVDFFAPWCGPCQQLAPELQKAARALRSYDERVHVGSVDCQAYSQFCSKQGVSSYPSIRLYPAVNSKRRVQAYYPYPQNMWRNADTIERWVFGMLPSLVTSLGNDYWTTVLDSDEPWIVDFYAPWCGHCVQFSPVYEQIAKALDGKVKLAKVDCDQWPGVCQGAQVQAYPTVRFYRGRQGGKRQNIWGMQLQTQHKDTIVQTVLNQIRESHDEL